MRQRLLIAMLLASLAGCASELDQEIERCGVGGEAAVESIQYLLSQSLSHLHQTSFPREAESFCSSAWLLRGELWTAYRCKRGLTMLWQEVELSPDDQGIECHWMSSLKKGEAAPPDKLRALKQAAEAYAAMAAAYKERLRAQ